LGFYQPAEWGLLLAKLELYLLKWVFDKLHSAFIPLNWGYYAPTRTCYPPSRANNNAHDDLIADTEQVNIDVRALTYYFNSLGALQNAWIAYVNAMIEAPVTSWINKDILETASNMGHSITAIFNLLKFYRFSDQDKTHRTFKQMHATITNALVRLEDVPAFNDQINILIAALRNFQTSFNRCPPLYQCKANVALPKLRKVK
jgi:hypothetical protein